MTAERSADARFGEAEASIPFRLRPDIAITEAADPDVGGKKFFLKVMGTGEVFEFGEEELFICRKLDGTITPNELRGAFQIRFAMQLSERKLIEFLGELRAMGLLIGSDGGRESGASRSAWGSTMFDEAIRREQPGRREEEEARPRQPDHRQSRSSSGDNAFQIRLFDPEGLLRRVAWLFGPVRYLTWLLIPAVLVSVLILFHRIDYFVYDFHRSWGNLVIVPRLLTGLFILSLVCNVAQGAVATAFGARIREFKIAFVFGFLPRFSLDMAPVGELSRRGRLWSYAAPLMMRLAIFSIGSLIWISYRSTGTWWPDFALLLAELSLLEFFIDAMPFFPNHGYFWISNYLGSPMYGMTAFKYIGRRLSGRPIPENLTPLRQWGLAFFALAVIIYMGLLIVPLMLMMALLLEARFSGTGVIIFLVFFGLLVMWLIVSSRVVTRLRRAGGAPDGHNAVVPFRAEAAAVVPFRRDLPAARGQTLPDFQRDLDAYDRQRRRSRLLPRLLWLAALVAITIVAFLPYPYEAGGQFNVLPTARVEVHTRADGEVVKVLAKEGEWVEENQVLATMSAWNEERNVAVTAADLDKSRAKLRVLEEGAKPEEVELARKQVESARARVTFSDLQAKRAEILIRDGHISQAKADEAITELQKNRADLAVAEANLQLIKSGATTSEIEALRAEVRGLEQELVYRTEQLERTKIRAPAAGRIVTPNLHFMLGKYMPTGALFAELEDNRVAQVEIDLPESDIGEIQLGNQVRVKAWQESDLEIIGAVVAIAPVAEKRDYGKVIRVKTMLPNEDGALRSGMTGFAKIEGPEMPVWEAYTRMLVRFFRIEFWSWIP